MSCIVSGSRRYSITRVRRIHIIPYCSFNIFSVLKILCKISPLKSLCRKFINAKLRCIRNGV